MGLIETLCINLVEHPPPIAVGALIAYVLGRPWVSPRPAAIMVSNNGTYMGAFEGVEQLVVLGPSKTIEYALVQFFVECGLDMDEVWEWSIRYGQRVMDWRNRQN